MPKKLFIALIILAVLVFLTFVVEGVLIYYQQKAIKQLQNQIVNSLPNPGSSDLSQAKSSPSIVAAAQKTIIDSIKDISGKVTLIAGKNITVEADIVDFSKLPGLTEEELAKSVDSFPKTKKLYNVALNDKTQVSGKSTDWIYTGDSIHVFANELVYKTDSLTAAKVVLPEFEAKQSSVQDVLKNNKTIVGNIVEITNKSLTVKTKIPDFSKITDIKLSSGQPPPTIEKIYKVFINDKTEFSDKKLKEIKVNDIVQIFTDILVYDISEFTATKIIFPLVKP